MLHFILVLFLHGSPDHHDSDMRLMAIRELKTNCPGFLKKKKNFFGINIYLLLKIHENQVHIKRSIKQSKALV